MHLTVGQMKQYKINV